jgi:hypothetical protein
MQKNLNELKTVRTAPISRYVRKVAAKKDTLGSKMRLIVRRLTDIGAKELGSGVRASVLESPKKDSVIKLYGKDTAYDSFLDHVKTNKENPHLPKIMQRGKIPLDKTGKNHLHVVRMENLMPLSQEHELRDIIPNGIAGTPEKIRGQLDSGQHDALKKKYPEFHKALSDIVEIHRRYNKNPPLIDLHLGNVMQRKDGTPVITDPMINWGDDTETTDISNSKKISEPLSTDQLRQKVEPKVKLTSSDRRLLDQLGSDPGVFKEEAPVNNVGSGNIAGVGVGPKGEPGRNPSLMPMVRRSKDFAGKAVFSVPPKLYDDARLEKRKYQRWTKYLDENSYDELAPIREYANANPAMPIIIENEKTGAMCYVKYGSKGK